LTFTELTSIPFLRRKPVANAGFTWNRGRTPATLPSHYHGRTVVVSAADAEPRTWSTLPVHGGEAQRSQPESTALIYLASSASAQRPKEIGQHRRRPSPGRPTLRVAGGMGQDSCTLHESGKHHSHQRLRCDDLPSSQTSWEDASLPPRRANRSPVSMCLSNDVSLDVHMFHVKPWTDEINVQHCGW